MMIAFSPLAGGMLTDKYLNGIPKDSRAGHDPRYLKASMITPEVLKQIARLNSIAKRRGQSLAQMALQWALSDRRMTSVIIGASRGQQVIENLKALSFPELTAEELKEIG